jgi:anti-sigma regulatory factor (Ser/Thr protein kinase)
MTPGAPRAQFQRVIPSHPAAVETVPGELRAFLGCHGVTGACFSVELLARECLRNALIHGNGGNRAKWIQVDVHVGRRWIRLQVEDEGAGFDWRRVRRAPPDETATSGRGLVLCTVYAARMAFNGTGNRITLWIAKKEDGCA